MNSPRIENRRVGLTWAGWRSDTWALQRAGWQISAQEDVSSMHIRIAIKHPGSGMYGFSQPYSHRQEHMLRGVSMDSGFELPIYAMGQNMVFQTYMIDTDVLNGFNPVDAQPSLVTRNITNMEDLRIFRPLKKEQEIIIPEQNISELLAKIQELQAPEQEEIRKRRRKEIRRMMRERNEDVNEYQLETNIVAQVATIVGW